MNSQQKAVLQMALSSLTTAANFDDLGPIILLLISIRRLGLSPHDDDALTTIIENLQSLSLTSDSATFNDAIMRQLPLIDSLLKS